MHTVIANMGNFHNRNLNPNRENIIIWTAMNLNPIRSLRLRVIRIGILIQMQNYKNRNVIKRKDLWNFFILFIFCSFFHFFLVCPFLLAPSSDLDAFHLAANMFWFFRGYFLEYIPFPSTWLQVYSDFFSRGCFWDKLDFSDFIFIVFHGFLPLVFRVLIKNNKSKNKQ